MKTILIALVLLQSVPTANVDLNRTNANLSESQLTSATITGPRFGLKGAYAVDGPVFAQPLFVSGITISGKSRDLVIVATMSNSVYAFDGNVPSTSPIWSNLRFATVFPNKKEDFTARASGASLRPSWMRQT